MEVPEARRYPLLSGSVAEPDRGRTHTARQCLGGLPPHSAYSGISTKEARRNPDGHDSRSCRQLGMPARFIARMTAVCASLSSAVATCTDMLLLPSLEAGSAWGCRGQGADQVVGGDDANRPAVAIHHCQDVHAVFIRQPGRFTSGRSAATTSGPARISCHTRRLATSRMGRWPHRTPP